MQEFRTALLMAFLDYGFWASNNLINSSISSSLLSLRSNISGAIAAAVEDSPLDFLSCSAFLELSEVLMCGYEICKRKKRFYICM